jgi:cytochrome P450
MSSTRPRGTTITVSDYGVVRDAFRRKELRQALYDDGADVMADCLLTLHGDSHRARRRLENRLFRRDVFTRWERQVLGTTVDDALAPFVAEGRGDLLPIGYRTTMNLTAFIAGVDRPHGPPDET